MRRVFPAVGDTDAVDTLANIGVLEDVYGERTILGANDHHRQTRDGDGSASCLILALKDAKHGVE